MALPNLSLDSTSESVLAEHVHCRTTMGADPLAAAHAPAFDALITDGIEVTTLRLQLVIAIAQARANGFQLDLQLNKFVDTLVLALLKITDRDRGDPLWFVFLKGKEPAQIKKFLLGEQLALMLLWPAALAASPHQELKDIGTALAPVLPLAVKAEQAIADTKQALVTFDNVGRWRQHIDRSNAARATAYGDLLEVPHKNPALNLPSDYAEQFFLHDTSRRGAGKPRSAEEIGKEMKGYTEKAAALQGPLAEAVKREADDEAERVRLADVQKELDAVTQLEKESRDRKKALEKELGKKK
jgi:hypothetical protein